MKLEVGQDMSNFLYNTPYNENINYLDNIKGKKSCTIIFKILWMYSLSAGTDGDSRKYR